jgi:monoamine oxidase
MARTPFMTIFRRALAASRHEPSRRDFLRTGAMAGAALAIPSLLPGCGRPSDIHVDQSVNVAVVGAGLAGLHCAFLLQERGVKVNVYEATGRVGGRCMTSKDLLAPGTWTELGGEFIDSGHGDMLNLADRFGLELIDVGTRRTGNDDTFYFHGRHFTMEDIVTEIAPYLDRIHEDIARLPSSFADLATSPARSFDVMSLDSYLVSLGISGWLRSFLEVAFVTENGLELGDQSALNFLTIVSADVSDGSFHPFGASDERYVVRGGVQQITNNLAAPLQRSIHTRHVLSRVEASGSKYVLTFRKDIDTVTVMADHVVLALPFTALRNVDLDVDLPEVKRRAIAELRYGSNGKVFLGFTEPFWRADGHTGMILTDLPLQLVWENTHVTGNPGAGLTAYYGGSMSRVLGAMSTDAAAQQLYGHLAEIWPSAATAIRGRAERMHWPSQPFVNASYSAYGPGQWTAFYGVEGASVGNLHFAGEHCSLDHKGYMNGAAETGRLAAEKIFPGR